MRRTKILPLIQRDGEKAGGQDTPGRPALRGVRGWLEPYVMLRTLLEGVLGDASPPELKALLEWVFSGRGLYLYTR